MVNNVMEYFSEETCEQAEISLEKARTAHKKYLLKNQNEDLLEAVNQYLLTVKMNPSIEESYYRLASLMLENGEIGLESAIEQCKTAISMNPKNPNAHIYTGYFLELANNYSQAALEYKESIKLTGINSARARLLYASNVLKNIKISGNILDVPKFLYYFTTGSMLLGFDKTFLKMIFQNCRDLVGVNAYKTLGKMFENLNVFEFSLKIYEKATNKTGHVSLFYSKMGDLLMKKEDYDEALNCYKKAYQNQPNDRENLLKLATITRAYLPENIDEAVDYYNALLKFSKDTAQIYYELGHLYLKKKDNFHAMVAFKLALDLEPENPYYNNAIGFAYLQLQMYDDAIEHYQEAIKLNPDERWTSLVCQTLGLVYLDIKCDFEAAISVFNAGLVLDKTNYGLYIALADVYMAQDDTDKAIQTYCDAAGVNTENHIAYLKMGLALWERGYTEEALVAYNKAIQLNPSCDTAYNNLGVVYLEEMRDYNESLKLFKSAIELNPSYTLAYFNVGRSLEALGENKEAADYYQMAINLNRLNPEIDEEDIQDKIKGLFNL